MKSILLLVLTVLCVLMSASPIYADQPLPPSFLTAIGDLDGKVPLFWFKPISDTSELAYDDGSMDNHLHVSPEWHHNCFAVRMTSPKLPFHLLKSKVFISYDDSSTGPDYDFEAPFFITVNLDSGGIPRNTFLDSVPAQATGTDILESEGEWVEVEHNLLMLDDSSGIDPLNFWIVFHWLEDSPVSPMVGADKSPNQGRSFWGMKNSPHFEWHERSDYNIMIRTVIVTNGDDPCDADSFKIYRSDSGFCFSDTNLIGSVPFDQFHYVDTDVNNDQTYFYQITSVNSGDESEESNGASASPKKGAEIVTDPSSFDVSLGSQGEVFKQLTLTNSGGLSLDFNIEIDLEEQSWMGGSNEFGYTWTDKNLQGAFDYSWIDIKDCGEEIGDSGDDNKDYGFFELNFSFPFYGNQFDSLRIGSDGWTSFSSFPPCYTDTFLCYFNKELPYMWGPYNLIAPFWDDLIFSDSSKIYFYSNDFDSAIISFINLDHWSYGGPYTFQTILNKNGEITFQYHRLGDRLNSNTVGIQSWNGVKGLQVAYDQDYLEDSLWVRIRPSWILVDSMWGTIQPGESKILNLTFDRFSYPQGIHHANLIINSRDKNHDLSPIEIPVTLCIDTTTSVDLEEDQRPLAFALFQNYPNPFNPATAIRFNVQGSRFRIPVHTTLKIYNVLGQRVRTLVGEPKSAGSYEVIWDGKDDRGKEVASGIYFYQLTAGDYKETKKMTLIR